MRGKYIRTEAVKQKQREVMKITAQSYDWASMKQKANATFINNGTKQGRPKTLMDRECIQCHEIYSPVRSSQKYCVSKCYYKSKEGRPVQTTEFLKSMDRSYTQTESFASKQRNPTTPAFRKFRNRVATLTEKTYVKYQHEINPNNHPRTIAGVNGGYQLDHKVSCRRAFDQGLTEEWVSSKDNLQMLPWKENLIKSHKE